MSATLMQLGGVLFTIAPLNQHSRSRDTQGDFVEKQVIGARMPLEYVGKGIELVTVCGRVFPQAFGGLGELAALQSMLDGGQAQMVMLGTGPLSGGSDSWYVVDHISERSSQLDGSGIGKIIEFEVVLRRDVAPGADGYAGSMF